MALHSRVIEGQGKVKSILTVNIVVVAVEECQ